MLFEVYLGKKISKFFPAGPFFRLLQIKYLPKCPYFKKTPLPLKNYWLRAWANERNRGGL